MANFLLNGDLCQMATQRRFLVNQGFSVTQTDVYPTLKEDDVERALTHIWINKVDGWWNYQTQLVSMGICTKDEFRKALKGA